MVSALPAWSDEWTPYIYTVADPPEPGYKLIPPIRRGREAIVYLDFIVRYYDSLPGIVAFVHPTQEQWHNEVEDLGPLTGRILRYLRIDSVERLGYVNLRCKHDPGCPVSVSPLEPTETDIQNKDIRMYFADVYAYLFSEQENVPAHIGGICCAQFAVSRQRIRQRPRASYQRMLQWCATQNVTDSFGGRMGVREGLAYHLRHGATVLPLGAAVPTGFIRLVWRPSRARNQYK
ncbi:hypothetical protein PG994_005377 [Apiospora phragmitis]|uniref:Uncharacterized protein n=1 Tax=Apiospora phragmitis TaxID=2905665 RepID=A0ABR1VC26_9PEZI